MKMLTPAFNTAPLDTPTVAVRKKYISPIHGGEVAARISIALPGSILQVMGWKAQVKLGVGWSPTLKAFVLTQSPRGFTIVRNGRPSGRINFSAKRAVEIGAPDYSEKEISALPARFTIAGGDLIVWDALGTQP